nr:unnamed protein product [Spirometra erinaceieuropaei]
MQSNQKLCWLRDESEGYVLARILQSDEDTTKCALQKDSSKIFEIPTTQVLLAEPRDHFPDDNCALINLNEATLLENVKQRYMRDKIYTYVANILIAVNPYREIPQLYSKETVQMYRGKSLGVLPPHAFAIADKAYRDMRMQKASQAIVVSGESGAGKTETTKYVLRYLTESYGAEAGIIERNIIESNPLLEAFGNAKTVRNNNSSRFGKFIEISFTKAGTVCGGSIEHYILEKSRLVFQAPGERNFHFFYQMFAGASEQLRSQLGLTNPADFRYLSGGCTQYFLQDRNANVLPQAVQSEDQKQLGPLRDITMDDYDDFHTTVRVFDGMNMTANDKESLFSILGGILHLGNIAFDDGSAVQSGCRVSPKTETSLKKAADLLGMNRDTLAKALTARVTGAMGFKIALSRENAANVRDGLAKAIYSRLFEWLVSMVNRAIPNTQQYTYVGLLDIAGFEHFEENSFEQFCINYCNEKLQQFFNERILKEEQIVYQREGLSVQQVNFTDNQDCIDLMEKTKTGILALLDEESRLPAGTSAHFTAEVHRIHADNKRLTVPRKLKIKLLDEEGFVLYHFAGPVCYTTDKFIAKNNDALHSSLEELLHSSKNKLLRQMHNPNESKSWTLKKIQQNIAGKINFISVAKKFTEQLNSLILKLRSTGTNFIRCVKPNSTMSAHEFEGESCLDQLRFFGLTDVLVLMEKGFPSRTQFTELYEAYKPLLSKDLKRLEPRTFLKALFNALGIDDDHYKFGVSKVFFRAGKFAEFDDLLRMDPEHLSQLVERVRVWILHYRWRKAIYGALCVIKLQKKIAYREKMIIQAQKYVRGWLCRQKHKKLLDALRQLRTLVAQLDQVKAEYEHLNGYKGTGLANVDQASFEIAQLQRQLRDFDKVKYSDIVAGLDHLRANMADIQNELRKHQDLERQTGHQEEEEKKNDKALEETTKNGIVNGENGLMNGFIQPTLVEAVHADPSALLSAPNGVHSSLHILDAQTSDPSIWDHEVAQMTFKQLRQRIDNSKDESEKSACEKELSRRLIAYTQYKKDKLASRINGTTDVVTSN